MPDDHLGPFHVLEVTTADPEEDERYVLTHPPECVHVVRSQRGVVVSEDWECAVQEEIYNVGDEILEGTEPGRTYIVRHVAHKSRGSDWVEWDTELEIQEVDAPPVPS